MNRLPFLKKLLEIRRMAYHNFEEVVKDCIIVFFKFSDHNWYEIVSSDGKSFIRRTEEPLITPPNYQEEFDYPITCYHKFKVNKFGRLIRVDELLWKGKQDESCGFIFYFDNNTYLYVVEDDEELILSENRNATLPEWLISEKIYLDT
jgi:hypothetical protein